MKPFAKTLAFAAMVVGLVARPVAAETKPNVILILADDLSASALGCYGCQSVKTPVLDRLAKEGMRYTHCYSPQVCMPSRTELLTGKYAHRNYVGRGNVAVGERTIASELKKAGYATCQVEKWHVQARGGAMPPQVGFDEHYLTKLAHNYYDPVVHINGKKKAFKGGYGPKVCQKCAFDFITRHRDRPFFLYYAMHLPHAPYHAPPGFDLGEKPSHSDRYRAMIEHQDVMVGELVKYLESLRLRKRTLMIFTGDNGTPRGIHYRTGGRMVEGGKGSMLDSGTHVPLIVNWPGTVSRDIVTNALVDFADFLPTAMEVAGRKPTPAMKLDGQSFYRQLLGDPKAPVRELAFKFGCRNGGKGALPVGYWARDQRWKLYGNGRFYDMVNDPEEKQAIEISSLKGNGITAHRRLTEAIKQLGAEAALRRFKKKGPPKQDRNEGKQASTLSRWLLRKQK